MKRVLALFIAVYSITGFGQTITVIDDEKGFPVKGAAIYNKNLSISIITNDDGVADISAFSSTDIIIISHVSYSNYNTSKEDLKKNKYRILLLKKTAHLDEVVLSVFRNKESSKRIAQQTIALTRDDIFKESPQTTADLLASVPGIKVQKSQFGGGSPVLRGMESNRVLLVVDGVRMNNAIYRKGHLQNSITVSPTQLERTEIVFGPSSVIYGSDALGGVIHYYTRTPKTAEKDTIKSGFFSRFGTVNQEVTTSVSAELSFKNWASYTSVSYSSFGDLQMGEKRSHGFSEWGLVPNYSENIGDNYVVNQTINSDPTIQRNTGYNQTDVLQKFYFPLSEKTDLNVNLQYSTSSNIPRFDKLSELKSGMLKFAEWYYGPQKRFLASTQLSINPQKKWLQKGTFTIAYQNIKESRIQRKFGSLERLYRTEGVDVYSINGDFTVPLTNDKNRNFSYGFEVTYNDVTSTAEGKNISVSNNKVVGFDDTFIVQSRFPDGGSSYLSTAVYVDYRQDLNKKSTLNTGIRLTDTRLEAKWIDQTFLTLPQKQINIKNSALTLTFGYVYKPTKNWQMKSVISSGFRSPNLDDVGKIREKNGIVTLPNIQLTPEYAYSGEVGVQKFFNDRTFSLGFNMYYTFLVHNIARRPDDDQIVYDGELADVVINRNNLGGYIKGFTANYTGRLNHNWRTSGFITYTEGESKGYTESSAAEKIIEPMSSIPPLFGRFELSYRKNKTEVSASFRFNAKKDISKYNISEGIDNHVQTPIVDASATDDVDKYYGTPSWSTFGLNGRYTVNENFTIQGTVTNLFDEHYKEFASGISAPGRNFSVSVQANF
jgi:hemoglobin/transferrin/lactoferrin receptor protein